MAFQAVLFATAWKAVVQVVRRSNLAQGVREFVTCDCKPEREEAFSIGISLFTLRVTMFLQIRWRIPGRPHLARILNISAKTEYACIAVLELAAHYETGQPVRIRRIAEAHGIPSRFLVQILLQLKGAGMVASTRGAAGGYQLVRDPAELSLGAVMAVIEGRATQVSSNTTKKTPTSRVLRDVWKKVDQVQREILSEITLADLVKRIGRQTENMYYI